MSAWQERVDVQTDPQVLLEHVVRYRFASPLVAGADAWVDLGCGTGLPAATAFGASRPEHVLLVDLDADALLAAEQRFAGPGTQTASADLASEEGLAALDARVRAMADGRSVCVTCFEVIEHLTDFGPAIGWLGALVAEVSATVVLSVPNDAFWSLHNPYHHTMWGDGAFEEFRRLLPGDAVVAHQVALHGSALLPLGGEGEMSQRVAVDLRPQAVPTHFLVAFGSRGAELSPVAGVEQLDLQERRAWERQRDGDLAWLRQRNLDLEREVERLQEQLAAPDGRAGS